LGGHRQDPGDVPVQVHREGFAPVMLYGLQHDLIDQAADDGRVKNINNISTLAARARKARLMGP
jgi:hypothetical protein